MAHRLALLNDRSMILGITAVKLASVMAVPSFIQKELRQLEVFFVASLVI